MLKQGKTAALYAYQRHPDPYPCYLFHQHAGKPAPCATHVQAIALMVLRQAEDPKFSLYGELPSPAAPSSNVAPHAGLGPLGPLGMPAPFHPGLALPFMPHGLPGGAGLPPYGLAASSGMGPGGCAVLVGIWDGWGNHRSLASLPPTFLSALGGFHWPARERHLV